MDLVEKYIGEGGGTFGYSSNMDSDNHRTLENLIKSNNGIWKSTKQRWFLTKSWGYDRRIGEGKDPIFSSGSHVKQMRGISGVKKGEYLVEINAYMVFGKRGAGQGTRRLEWGYVIDDVGVREKYKYGFTYSDGGHASQIDLSKTKKEWTRQENDEVEAFREIVAQEDMNQKKKIQADIAQLNKSGYIGVIGERVKDLEVEVVRQHFFETRFGQSSITVMKDEEGNILQHFGRNNLKKGDKKKIDFTVKGHEQAEINKWNKVAYKFTAISRVKGK